MSEQKIESEKWVDSAADLVEAYRELITIRVVEHTSLGLSISVIGVLSLILAVFVLLFTGMGAAWWIGEHINNMKVGFFIVGGTYVLFFGLLLLLSPKVLLPGIRNLIIKKMYEQD